MKRSILIIIFFFLISFLASDINGQENSKDTSNYPYWIDMMQDRNTNFFLTQKAFETYWNGKKISKGKGWKQFKRWEWYWSTRINKDGSFPAADKNKQAYESFFSKNPSNSGNWTEKGPVLLPTNGPGQPNGTGRINAIAFHPSDTSIFYVGAPSGGLWKTTDHGSTWSGLTDHLPTLGVSSIIVDYQNPDIVFIGTGDRDGGNAHGIGVMKSIDAGISWNTANTGMGNVTVGHMIQHPACPDTIFAATSNGIFKTIDGGQNWTLKSLALNFKDIRFKPGSPDTLYASFGSNFYRSTDAGDNWSHISGMISGDRGVIGVTPADPDYVYYLIGGSGGLKGFYRSTNSGETFTLQANTPNTLGYESDGSDNASQAWYDLCIAVHPQDEDLIFTGGINIWKSADGGVTWNCSAHWWGQNGLPAVHADQHTLEYNPINNILFSGNDGGLHFTSDFGSSYPELSSGIAVAQIYRIGQSSILPDLVVNGYQDNGTGVFHGAPNNPFHTVYGGDGMECAVDYSDTNCIYGELYYGKIFRSLNGVFGSFYPIAGNNINGINQSGGWVTPFIIANDNPNTMFIGYKDVWRTNNVKDPNGSNIVWTKISSNIGNTDSRDIEQSLSAPNTVYVVKSNGAIFRTDNANSTNPLPTWSFASSPGTIDLEIHPNDSSIVYITNGSTIKKSSDKGVTWSDITGSLPNTNINCLTYDSRLGIESIYAGTDIGVFYYNENIGDWIVFSNGLPASAEITELEIFYHPTQIEESLISASTYGRGLWQSGLYSDPNAIPIANFTVEESQICQYDTVQFYDMSTNQPNNWQWIFEPDAVTFVNGTNSNSQNPSVVFNYPHYYSVTLHASNAAGSDTIHKEDFIANYTQNYVEISITASPSNIVAPGTRVTFSTSTVNAGANPSYEWFVNNISTGNTNSTYTTTALQNGDLVHCVFVPDVSCPSSDFLISNVISMQMANSIEDDTENQFELFPNPLNGNLLFIRNNNNAKNITIEIFDTMTKLRGTKMLFLNNGETASIDFSQYASGVYLIKITDENKELKKFIIKK